MKLPSPLLLDGGLSNQLEKQGHNLNDPLWTAKLLHSNREAITQAHLTYLEAGAQCIITSSYQASIPGFIKSGFSKEEAQQLLLNSVEVALTARNRYLESVSPAKKIWIAASIGPYGAYLADGSEYRGNYGIEKQALFDFHKERVEILDNSEADILACETIPSLEEAIVLGQLLQNTSKPSWISFSCKDGKHLNDGSQLKESISFFKDHPRIFALGINCTQPIFISDLISIIKKEAPSKQIVIYPNSGENFHPDTKEWSGGIDPHFHPDNIKKWIENGANIIGGCCRIGPKEIRALFKSEIF